MYHPKGYVHANIKGAKAPANLKMSPKTHPKRSPSPALTLGRSSFSSIRERDSDLAQTFTSSKISSYSSQDLHHLLDEVAVGDEPSTPTTPLAHPSAAFDVPDDSTVLLSPGSLGAHDRRWSAGSEDEDRQDDIAQSVVRSMAWLSGGPQHDFHQEAMEVDPAPTRQLFEMLPFEIHRLIVDHLMLDTPPNGVDRRNVDLMSLLVTSKALSGKTLEALYRRVTIPHSRIFQKFRAQLEAHSSRGVWVRRLDFSHFSPVVLFSTASKRKAAQNLTAETLFRCLSLTPYLQEFLAQDYIDSDIDENVLRKLFIELPCLKALDLCGCSAVTFRNAFVALVESQDSDSPDSVSWPEHLSIQRLSLHKCRTLPPAVFEFLLPKLNRLTHLDLAGTSVTDSALQSIPKTARITHLNLDKCTLLTAQGVIDFLANHPAVNQNSLVFLSLGFNAATAQLLDIEDVSRLLPVLPQTLRSLNLKGSKMDQSHLSQLSLLSKHLEELALGRCLTLADVGTLVIPPKEQIATHNNGDEWVPHALRYLDISDMDAETLDLSFLYIDSHLLDPATGPLEVIEVSDNVFKRVEKTKVQLNRMGWRPSEIGTRSWIVRGSHPAGKGATSTSGSFAMEDGQRPWKMGAQSWGMRKIPVAYAKVGGMYGSYMFGKRL